MPDMAPGLAAVSERTPATGILVDGMRSQVERYLILIHETVTNAKTRLENYPKTPQEALILEPEHERMCILNDIESKSVLGDFIKQEIENGVRSFIRRGINDFATKLSQGDFNRARRFEIPDEPFIPERVLRSDLLQGDIYGLDESNAEGFVRQADELFSLNGILGLLQSATSFGGFGSDHPVRYRLWPDGRIPYEISSRYGREARNKMAAAINDLHDQTCLRLVPRNGEQDYIYFSPRAGCYSMVGRSGGKQDISLSDGCFQHGTIIHEIMHAAGFFHEQGRTDRDDHVQIRYENIIPGYHSQFRKLSLEAVEKLTPYDYNSIMHYGANYFSRNGRDTVVPKRRGVNIGQRRAMSVLDIEKINKLYECDGNIGQGGKVTLNKPSPQKPNQLSKPKPQSNRFPRPPPPPKRSRPQQEQSLQKLQNGIQLFNQGLRLYNFLKALLP